MKFQPISSSAVRAGGEIRARMELTAGKILHQTDVEHLFAAPFHHRKTEPDVPGGFAGYGMLLDAIVKAAALLRMRNSPSLSAASSDSILPKKR